MKNKVSDLRDYLFEQIERLNNKDLSNKEMQREIERANALQGLGKVIVESAKVQVIAIKMFGKNSEILPEITGSATDFVNTPNQAT